ncbi:hypothetical protein ACOBQX_10650 [Actinokineospora sp. G85]|uniref:hypothetical protein n=1 Tax=Actinokineospora sp. G85 TaxID=3406626 RepID=UPI003C723037
MASSFDPKTVAPLQWAGIGAGAVALLSSFFPWHTADFGLTTDNAWGHGVGAVVPVLLLIAAAVVVVLPLVGVAIPHQPLIWLGLAGLAEVALLAQWVLFPGDVSEGPNFGFFVVMFTAAVSTAGATVAFLSSRKPVS